MDLESPITEIERKHPLATERGVLLFTWLLVHMGAMCPKCGFGTRAVSKKWRKCKRCGERVARRELPDSAEAESGSTVKADETESHT